MDAFLNGTLSGFGSVRFDSGYPGGYFKGFALSVDAIGADPSLGGGWQSLSLGSMQMNTNELPAGGYIRTSIREIERISYGEVSMSRGWSPGTSARITEWFSWARSNGGTTVAVTVEVPSDAAGPASVGGSLASMLWSSLSRLGVSPSEIPGKKFNIIFRDCIPREWQAPRMQAGLLNSYTGTVQEPTTIETLTFSFSGYKIESFSGATPMVDSSIATEEKVEPCKLVIIPNTGGATRKMLASMSSWTNGQSLTSGLLGLGALSNAGARQIAWLASMYDSVEFFLPPASIKVTKGSSWSTGLSSRAKESGPVTFKGTKPMKMSFSFLMKTQERGLFDNGLMGAIQGGGGLAGLLAGAVGLGDSLGIGSKNSVMTDLKKLVSLCENYDSSPLSFLSTAKSPPLVMLLWGQFASPLMYITDLSAEIVRFGSDGTPTKALGQIELRQYPSTAGSTNPTSGGFSPELVETVLAGDTLAHLAYRSYQSPARWRDVAEHNKVDDPLRVRSGAKMRLPAAEQLPSRTHGGSVPDEDLDELNFDEIDEDY
ncbi:MAG: hypothetical protein ACR2JS_04295 [Candidatus Nanopelagicales bacterium]